MGRGSWWCCAGDSVVCITVCGMPDGALVPRRCTALHWRRGDCNELPQILAAEATALAGRRILAQAGAAEVVAAGPIGASQGSSCAAALGACHVAVAGAAQDAQLHSVVQARVVSGHAQLGRVPDDGADEKDARPEQAAALPLLMTAGKASLVAAALALLEHYDAGARAAGGGGAAPITQLPAPCGLVLAAAAAGLSPPAPRPQSRASRPPLRCQLPHHCCNPSRGECSRCGCHNGWRPHAPLQTRGSGT
jgi:hypothetical protein